MLKTWLNRFISLVKKIPIYGWVFGAVYFGLQYGIYRLGDLISRLLGTISYAWCPKIAFIDDLVPVFAPFAVIYVFSYVFWICGPIAVSLTKKKNFLNYIIGLSIAYAVGFLFFAFLPSYMNRVEENLMEIASRPGFFYGILATIYGADGADFGFNLFPSYHCLISIYCYLGVRKQPEISKGFRIYSLVMALLICASTVLTKQHYVIDIVGGLGISILCYALVEKWNPGEKILDKKPDLKILMK